MLNLISIELIVKLIWETILARLRITLLPCMSRKKPSADDYLNRGALKDKLEDYDGAIADYTQATYINEKDSDAYYNRGLANAKKGLIRTAILDWRIAAEFGNERAKQKLNELDT